MSQEKVNRYKKEKANRKETMKKEKLKNMLRRCVVGVVAIGLVAGIGYSAYTTYQNTKTKDAVEIDYSAFDNFSQQLNEAAK